MSLPTSDIGLRATEVYNKFVCDKCKDQERRLVLRPHVFASKQEQKIHISIYLIDIGPASENILEVSKIIGFTA